MSVHVLLVVVAAMALYLWVFNRTMSRLSQEDRAIHDRGPRQIWVLLLWPALVIAVQVWADNAVVLMALSLVALVAMGLGHRAHIGRLRRTGMSPSGLSLVRRISWVGMCLLVALILLYALSGDVSS